MDGVNNYSCSCVAGYTGNYCEKGKVVYYTFFSLLSTLKPGEMQSFRISQSQLTLKKGLYAKRRIVNIHFFNPLTAIFFIQHHLSKRYATKLNFSV